MGFFFFFVLLRHSEKARQRCAMVPRQRPLFHHYLGAGYFDRV